ncbi:MAG: hypothetical protein V3U06_08395, partial [Candidatus Binatia bacterium]
ATLRTSQSRNGTTLCELALSPFIAFLLPHPLMFSTLRLRSNAELRGREMTPPQSNYFVQNYD